MTVNAMTLAKCPIVLCLLLGVSLYSAAETTYRINPGDVLIVYVWNEKDLSQEVLVRPDGMISLPLAGQVQAGGLAPDAVEKELATALGKYLKDEPSVTVTLKETTGYKVYVLGKVNRPGEYLISRPTDVMQALALAGGLNAFAAENAINVLRRDKDGAQSAIRFRYGDVKDGDNLKANIVLHSGDVVVVP
jgi:polysaccharide export outer membrane protein